MGGVFISYRKIDSADIVGRMYDDLSTRFESSEIFRDVTSIPLGTDFREAIENALKNCDVLIAVIGSQWLNAEDNNGKRRLDNPNDYVRIELEVALERGISIIPVIVGGGRFPTAIELPLSLRPLASRQGTYVRPDPDFAADMERLSQALKAFLKPATTATRYSTISATPTNDGNSLQQSFGFSMDLEPIAGGRRADLGIPYGVVYLGGCKFRLLLTNKGDKPLIVNSMKLQVQWSDLEPLVQEKVEYGYGRMFMPHQLIIQLKKDGYSGWWTLSLGDRLSDTPRPFNQDSIDLFESPQEPRMTFQIAPGELEVIDGALLPIDRGIYNVRIMAMAMNAHLQKTAKTTTTIKIVEADFK